MAWQPLQGGPSSYVPGQPHSALGQHSYAQSVAVPAANVNAFVQPPAVVPTATAVLRSVADLPACFRPVFEGYFRYFNNVQCECFRWARGHSWCLARQLVANVRQISLTPTGSTPACLLMYCTCSELFESSVNVVIAAPTGSGKTVLLELAILQLLSRSIDSSGAFVHRPGTAKAVYLAPARALVQEKAREWGQRFAGLGLTVKDVTGGHPALVVG